MTRTQQREVIARVVDLSVNGKRRRFARLRSLWHLRPASFRNRLARRLKSAEVLASGRGRLGAAQALALVFRGPPPRESFREFMNGGTNA